MFLTIGICNVASVGFQNPGASGIACTSSTVYIGSYSDTISWYDLSTTTGRLSYVDSFNDPAILNPSWITISNSKQFLYAVSEVEDFGGVYSGGVIAMSINSTTRNLSILNSISSGGAAPCHLAISPDDKFLYVSNYCSGNVAIIEISVDGSLGELIQLVNHSAEYTESCDQAHVHEVVLDGSRVLSNDLGLDSVFQYDKNPVSGVLHDPIRVPQTVAVDEGSGPRHLVIHPHLDYAFLLSELKSTITTLSYSRHTTKALTVLSTISSLPTDISTVDMAAAEVQISTDGKFVYASNRDISTDPNLNRSSITVFSVDVENSASLRLIQTVSSLGEHPRHFTLTPLGDFVIIANKNSDNIVTYTRDVQTGLLSNGYVHYDSTVTQPTQVLIVS